MKDKMAYLHSLPSRGCGHNAIYMYVIRRIDNHSDIFSLRGRSPEIDL
jgi:hypothetical protein